MSWINDPVFEGDDDWHIDPLPMTARPAFRLALLSSIHQAHPFDFVDEYQRLFEAFKPILQRDAERLTFMEKPGVTRRRKSIQAGDWTPFAHMKASVPPPDFTFIGFQFQSGKTLDNVYDAGPTSFRFKIDSTAWLDATVPVDAIDDGTLNVDDLKAALLQIPTRSGFSGYGMCISQDYLENGSDKNSLAYYVARKFPAIDALTIRSRGWANGYDDKPEATWIAGLNWLTLVGEPFLSRMGGVETITKGLPSEITWEKGNNTVLFQIGDRPITGEAGVDDELLPLYFELGSRLKPPGDVTPSEKHNRQVFGGMMVQEGLDWERRFYDRKWFEQGDAK